MNYNYYALFLCIVKDFSVSKALSEFGLLEGTDTNKKKVWKDVKICKICNVEKPMSEFNKARTKDGSSIYCRVCDNAKTREYARRKRG